MNCSAVLSVTFRTVLTLPPQPISRMRARSLLPEACISLAVAMAASSHASHRASCALLSTQCASPNMRIAGRARLPQNGQRGQLPPPPKAGASPSSGGGSLASACLRRPKARRLCPALAGSEAPGPPGAALRSAAAGPPPAASSKRPSSSVTAAPFAGAETLIASCVQVSLQSLAATPASDALRAATRIVSLSTAKAKSAGALQARWQHGPSLAPHCQTSVLPWHSRTSWASKKSKECPSTLEVNTKKAPAMPRTRCGSVSCRPSAPGGPKRPPRARAARAWISSATSDSRKRASRHRPTMP
mmetsp:Transcript_82740/g.229681  ORF Transcript_82740/g.229681 Transcript_82740/m.229681 type:complete len:302 (+) Transcript_82740:427-1332(+)